MKKQLKIINYDWQELASGWDFSGMRFFRDFFGIEIFPGFFRDRDFFILVEIWKYRNSGDRDFKIPKKFRVKNPENHEIRGNRDRDMKTSKNPEKISRAKSQYLGDRDLDLKIPEKSRVENPENPKI